MFELHEDGLTNVRLASGFTVRETRYGRGVSICEVEQLTREVCVALAFRHGKLAGGEFRYVRRAMEVTQQELAGQLGRTEQTIANWEKKDLVPVEASLLLKQLALKKFGYEHLVSRILEQIGMTMRGHEPVQMMFDSATKRWSSNFHPVTKAALMFDKQYVFQAGDIDERRFDCSRVAIESAFVTRLHVKYAGSNLPVLVDLAADDSSLDDPVFDSELSRIVTGLVAHRDSQRKHRTHR